MAESLTIPDRPDTKDVYDIRFLRETGLALLQKYSGNIWTDYNTHDPGVTLLETLCLALAELGYRADYDITEIIGSDAISGADTPFPPANKILPSSPVTGNDLRRKILDIDGIRNVRIKPSIVYPECEGLFEIEVYLSEDSDATKQRQKVEAELIELLESCRKAGEDFIKINFLDDEEVGFELDLEIDQRIDPAQFYHRIATLIEEYMSPYVHLYSYEELRNDGKDNTAIFEGPMMANGFTTTERLEEQRFRRNIYTSDLITLLMREQNIIAVRKIIIRDAADGVHFWSYPIKENCVPRISSDKTKITLWYKGAVVISQSLSNTRIDRNLKSLPKPFDFRVLNMISETHVTNSLTEYSPLQNDLPQTYGVGEYGLGGEAPPRRAAQANQLRGYLRIFDQILSDSFQQLAHLKHLLSPEHIGTTYATELVRGAAGEALLFKPFTDEFLSEHQHLNEHYVLERAWKKYGEENRQQNNDLLHDMTENDTLHFDRRNRVLNHLLARFGYDFSFFEYVCGYDEYELIRYKESLFRLLPVCDMFRSILHKPKGNYISGKPEKRKGFELRMALMTGIRSMNRDSLTADITDFIFSDKKNDPAVLLEIHTRKGEDPYRTLFETGGRKEMYMVEGTPGNKTIGLYNKSHRLIARCKAHGNNDPEELIKQIAGNIARLDEMTEGFHLLDHLLLRPDPACACFGFDVYMDGEIIFNCPTTFSVADRNKLLDDFKNCGGKANFFAVEEVSYNQYVVLFRDGKQPVKSCVRFSSEEAAFEAIAGFDLIFRSADRFVIKPVTTFRDAYSDTDDPFSNILTYILPDWPSRFNNEAYRKYIEEQFARETPAHLVVNIRWLNFTDMIYFEDCLSEWLDAKYVHKTTPEKQLQVLDALLQVIVS